MARRSLSAATLTVLAASSAPALAQFTASSSPDPGQPSVQFLIGIALMAAAGAVVAWQGAALAREALARRRRARPRHA